MDFWQEFSKTIGDAANQTVKEAEKLTDMAKVKYKIASLKTRLDDAYVTVGQLRYSESKGERVADEMYSGLFEKISDLTRQIEELENVMTELRNLDRCKKCGAKVNKKGCKFCPQCGEKLD